MYISAFSGFIKITVIPSLQELYFRAGVVSMLLNVFLIVMLLTFHIYWLGFMYIGREAALSNAQARKFTEVICDYGGGQRGDCKSNLR